MYYDVSLTIDVPDDLTQEEVEVSIRGCIAGWGAPIDWNLESVELHRSTPA